MIRLIVSAFPNSNITVSVVMILLLFLFNVGALFLFRLTASITLDPSNGNQTIVAGPYITMVMMIVIGTISWFIIILTIGETLHKSKKQ